MVNNKMVLLNAYELFLIKRILTIKLNLRNSDLKKSDFREIGDEFGIKDPATIRKLFNESYLENIPKLRRTFLDEFIKNLKIESVTNWDEFKKNYPAEDSGSSVREFIPIAHFSDLSDSWKKRIIEDVNLSVTKIFPGAKFSETLLELSDLEGKMMEEEEVELKPSRKMKNLFLNTTWYAYFIFYEHENPKIGRTIIRIKDNTNQVETETYKFAGANDFLGPVEFDENESFLIFNLKSKETQEKWAHIKVDVNTDIVPEIALGQYQNVGIGGVSLVYLK